MGRIILPKTRIIKPTMNFVFPHAGMLMKPQAEAAPPDIVVTHTADAASSTDASSYNFGTLSIGSADSSRIVVVVVGARSNSSADTIVYVSSLTIGGSAATAIKQVYGCQAGNTPVVASIYARAVTTGTTAAIVVTMNETCRNCGIVVYSMLYANGVSAYATGGSNSRSNPIYGNVNCEAGGAIIGAACGKLNAAVDIAWTGLTEDAEKDTDGNTAMSGAHDEFAEAQTPQTVYITSNANDRSIATASWSKAA